MEWKIIAPLVGILGIVLVSVGIWLALRRKGEKVRFLEIFVVCSIVIVIFVALSSVVYVFLQVVM